MLFGWFTSVSFSGLTLNKTSEPVQKPSICSIGKCMKWQRKSKIFGNLSIKSNPDISPYV